MRVVSHVFKLIKNKLIKTDLLLPLKTYGSDYGGFSIYDVYENKKMVVYSFGIGEDVSFSLDILDAFNGSEIFAFDPTPRSARYVKNHEIFERESFHFFEYGLSNRCGDTVFYLPKNSEYVSGSIKQRTELCEEGITVKMKDLCTIAEELKHNHIDILKMDIEGAEFDVVASLKTCLKHISIDQICMETHERFEGRIIGFFKLCVLNKRMHDLGYILIYNKDDDYTYINSSAV